MVSLPKSNDKRPGRLGARCRPDLVFVQTNHAHDAAIVAKDPVSLKYYRMRPDEYFVLKTLDQAHDLKEIRQKYEKRFAPSRITEPQLNQLLFRFHQNGLLISERSWQGDRLDDQRRKNLRQRWVQQLSGLLFIRFPGVDPEPLLKRLYPVVRPLLGWVGLISCIMVSLIALALFLTQLDRFVHEFPKMDQWINLEAVLVLAMVIGITKIGHELGHAVLCKHFGGECHQIGPMLLVFTPALYCDTSDSWMLPNRFHRAAVGLAGIGVEVFLASLAAIVWAFSGAGTVHYVAMNVMLVCSVSTLLFNANPLLRYDGYYILSDLWDLPNLAEISRRRLSAIIAKFALGVEDQPREPSSLVNEIGLLVYAIAAFCYRWALTLMILWFVIIALRPYRLESIGILIAISALGGILFSLLRGPWRFMTNPSKRMQLSMKRLGITTICLIGLTIVACYPFSSFVSGIARIIPREEIRVYIKTGGLLDTLSVQPGDRIASGDFIASLSNPDVQLDRITAQGRLETQRGVIDSLHFIRTQNPETANQLPAARALLEQLQTQFDKAEERVEGLRIRSPASGVVIAAPRQPQPNDQGQLVRWTGDPTASENQGCYLESGTELVSLAKTNQWDAEVIMTQSEVDRIEIGARVTLFLESSPGVPLKGTVVDLARSQWTAEQNNERRDHNDAANRTIPLSTSYSVRVELAPTSEATEEESSQAELNHAAHLLTGATAFVKVEAEDISVLGRIRRTLSSLLRFR